MKILIIRFSSIGDIVLTSPVIRTVKQQIKYAEVHFLTKKSFLFLVENDPHISKVHTYDQSLKEIILELKKEKFDLVIDLHKSLRSRYIKNQLGVKTISFNKLNYKKWLFTKLKLNKLPEKHLVDRYFDSLRKIKVKNDEQGLQYYYGSAEAYKRKLDAYTDKPFVVVAIGGTYFTKKLPNKKLIELVDAIDSKQVILIGGKEDVSNAKEIIDASNNSNCIDLCGQLTVHESAYLIEQADHVITHDTGMMHIAAAFKKPLSVVWGNTHPSFGMYPYGYSEKDKLYSYEIELNCRPCSKLGFNECPKGHFNCMNLQNIGEIVKNCNSVDSEQ